MAKFRVGDIVEMSADALDNYGEKWAGVPLVVESVATDYMPASKFFTSGMPKGFHPGYDETAAGEGLYDLSVVDGEGLPFSLYDWELEAA